MKGLPRPKEGGQSLYEARDTFVPSFVFPFWTGNWQFTSWWC